MIDSFFAENPVAPSSRLLYERVLVRFFADCPDPSICTAGDVLKFLDGTKWGSSLRYTAITTIKKYLRWKHGADHPALRVRVKRTAARPGRCLNAAKAYKLLESFDLATIKGKRDLAICCLALDNGLRVAELASLKYADVDLAERKLLVVIKGGNWEEAVFSEYTTSAIMDWCVHRKPGDDRLFQVSRDGLRVIVRRWGEKLGFRLSPHDLRRTFAVLSTKAGAPSRLVQVAGRWSDLKMVEHYTQSITAEDFQEYFPTSALMRRRS